MEVEEPDSLGVDIEPLDEDPEEGVLMLPPLCSELDAPLLGVDDEGSLEVAPLLAAPMGCDWKYSSHSARDTWPLLSLSASEKLGVWLLDWLDMPEVAPPELLSLLLAPLEGEVEGWVAAGGLLLPGVLED